MPVGEGAIRVRTGRSDIGLEGSGEASAAGAVEAAALSTRVRRVPSLRQVGTWLLDQMEIQADRWTLWAPVALGAGCAIYFALSQEPQAWIAWALIPFALLLLAGAGRWSRWRALTIGLTLVGCALAGFGVAKLRTEAVRAPVAVAGGRPQSVEGWVVDIASPGQGGQRLLIAPIQVGDWAHRDTPIRLRVTLRPGMTLPAPGQSVRLLAILNPPPPPASPGAYDFARDAYFESVGAVGLALRAPELASVERPAPWRLRLAMGVNAVRWRLTQRIVETLGVERGGLAAAMTTGHEAFIPREQVDNLRHHAFVLIANLVLL